MTMKSTLSTSSVESYPTHPAMTPARFTEATLRPTILAGNRGWLGSKQQDPSTGGTLI